MLQSESLKIASVIYFATVSAFLIKLRKTQLLKQILICLFFDDDYIPENFCRVLAALYLYSPEKKKELFSDSGWRCVEYKCGHIRMLNDCNHRMCVLAHLGESIEVGYTETDCYCSECIQKRI